MTGFNTQLSAECISLLNLVMALSNIVNLTKTNSHENIHNFDLKHILFNLDY